MIYETLGLISWTTLIALSRSHSIGDTPANITQIFCRDYHIFQTDFAASVANFRQGVLGFRRRDCIWGFAIWLGKGLGIDFAVGVGW